MGINDDNYIFLTQEEYELFMLQQLQLEFRESFDYNQGYDTTINEVQKQYNLRSKKNVEAPTKKTVQNQNKKIIESPATKVQQILPRETQQKSSSNQKNSSPNQKISSPKIAPNPKIVDITDTAIKHQLILKNLLLLKQHLLLIKKSADPKTTTAKTTVVKTTTATQTVPEKKIENTKTVETQIEKPTVEKRRESH